jgi:hypothetical protein
MKIVEAVFRSRVIAERRGMDRGEMIALHHILGDDLPIAVVMPVELIRQPVLSREMLPAPGGDLRPQIFGERRRLVVERDETRRSPSRDIGI